MLIKFSQSCSLILMLFLTACSSNAILQSNINSLIASPSRSAFIGMAVQSMQTGKMLYAKNVTNSFTPASNMKLFTATASLLYLGTNYHFYTTLLTDAARINHGVLQGNVYIKFSGDPGLTTQDLNALIIKLKNLGIHAITGNFYIDNSDYNGDSYGPGWMWDELNDCYAAPIQAVMLNHNCMSLQLNTAERINQPATLSQLPDFIQLTPVMNSVTTSSDTNQNCAVKLHTIDDMNIYKLSGCIAYQAKPMKLDFAIKNPNRYVKGVLLQLLKDHDIDLRGNVLMGRVFNKAKVLADHSSKPLSLLVNEMLKKSDNQIANSLLKKLGSIYFNQPVNWGNGVKAMQAILTQRVGIDFTQSSIVDGDGVSRYDLVTPAQTIQLLNYIYHNNIISSEFIADLPIAGEDGTLKKQMTNFIIKDKIKAKTGTMTGVSSLSGYAYTNKHQVLAFVIFINNFVGSDLELTDLEDELCKQLLESN